MKWPVRVLLLAVGEIWIVIKVWEMISNGVSAQWLDITRPSLFGIVGFASFIAYFFVRPLTKTKEMKIVVAKNSQYVPVDFSIATGVFLLICAFLAHPSNIDGWIPFVVGSLLCGSQAVITHLEQNERTDN